MKTGYYIVALAAIMLATFTSCRNAGAKNEAKNKADGMKHVVELTAEEFSAKVYDLQDGEMKYLGNKPAIVDFTAIWCGPCRSIAPILEELALEYKDQIVIYKVDVDKCKGLVETFGIQSIPAVLYIPLEGESSMTVGARSKAKFQEEINKILLGR